MRKTGLAASVTAVFSVCLCVGCGSEDDTTRNAGSGATGTGGGAGGAPSGIAGAPSGTAGAPSGTAGAPSGTAGAPSGTAGAPSGTAGAGAGAGGTEPGAIEDFAIIAVPDTQFFVAPWNGGEPAMFGAQFQWIRDNIDTLNIKFVTHLGDIVEQYPDGYQAVVPAQWATAVAAFDLIHGYVPYGMTLGNHDINNWQDVADDLSNYDANFPASRFDGMDWYGGNYNDNRNSYQLFSASGMDFIVLHLRWDPNADERAWGHQVLGDHSDRRAIVVSHQIDNWGLDGPGVQIWDEVVRSSPNVFLMLSGHHCTRETMSTHTNDAGATVTSIMSDYQCDNPQPVHLRIYTFRPTEDRIDVQTYSPWNDNFETDGDSQFSLDYDML